MLSLCGAQDHSFVQAHSANGASSPIPPLIFSFETGSQVDKGNLGLAVQPRMALIVVGKHVSTSVGLQDGFALAWDQP